MKQDQRIPKTVMFIICNEYGYIHTKLAGCWKKKKKKKRVYIRLEWDDFNAIGNISIGKYQSNLWLGFESSTLFSIEIKIECMARVV